MPSITPLQPDLPPFERLQREVIQPGLCTHCGTCVGLAPGALTMTASAQGPLPTLTGPASLVPELAYTACPGKGLSYPELAASVFGVAPQNWLVGVYRSVYLGFSATPAIRRQAASGGVITQTLVYLLEQKLIQGAVVVRQGRPQPWLAEPFIAQTVDEILAASQSVYAPVPVNTAAGRDGGLSGAPGLRGVARSGGLPAPPPAVGPPGRTEGGLRVGSLRRHQPLHRGHRQLPALPRRQIAGRGGRVALSGRGMAGLSPGADPVGQLFRTEKFYYNYLIPFYVTRSTLYSVDFTNELTDISVGDAWQPRLEAKGGGFSVVIARSARGEELLHAMQAAGQVALAAIELDEALAMHGHMLDFKKRGSFIRIQWRKAARVAGPGLWLCAGPHPGRALRSGSGHLAAVSRRAHAAGAAASLSLCRSACWGRSSTRRARVGNGCPSRSSGKGWRNTEFIVRPR